jgi:hypothetical protein
MPFDTGIDVMSRSSCVLPAAASRVLLSTIASWSDA